jgi:hypothetical protein
MRAFGPGHPNHEARPPPAPGEFDRRSHRRPRATGRQRQHRSGDIDANELGKLFTDGMQKNATREEFGKSIPGTLKLAEVFAAKKRLSAGDSFKVDFIPGSGTVISINGKLAVDTIAEPVFFTALMKIWLGANPADWQLKEALLSQSPKG